MAHSPTERDVVIGITASGRTPVLGAMKAACCRRQGHRRVGDPRGPVAVRPDHHFPDVGPDDHRLNPPKERYRPEDGAQYDIHRVNGRFGPDVLQPHGRYQPYKPSLHPGRRILRKLPDVAPMKYKTPWNKPTGRSRRRSSCSWRGRGR